MKLGGCSDIKIAYGMSCIIEISRNAFGHWERKNLNSPFSYRQWLFFHIRLFKLSILNSTFYFVA